jgi:hypothetical protein
MKPLPLLLLAAVLTPLHAEDQVGPKPTPGGASAALLGPGGRGLPVPTIGLPGLSEGSIGLVAPRRAGSRNGLHPFAMTDLIAMPGDQERLLDQLQLNLKVRTRPSPTPDAAPAPASAQEPRLP